MIDSLSIINLKNQWLIIDFSYELLNNKQWLFTMSL
jgi:hypothetical protein